jgi:hypothetical protein
LRCDWIYSGLAGNLPRNFHIWDWSLSTTDVTAYEGDGSMSKYLFGSFLLCAAVFLISQDPSGDWILQKID